MEEWRNFTSITHSICFTAFCNFSLVVIIVTFLVGVLGNALVIWITGIKMKKTVNTTWYLSLAVSDFISCAIFPPFDIIEVVTNMCFFRPFICHFTFALIFIPLISSVFLLVIISVDCCVSAVFPIWSQTNRTVDKASVVVVLTWVSSAALSTRFMFTGETDISKIVWSHLFGGFIMPFLIISLCYSVIILRLRTNGMMSLSSKSFRVKNVLIAMYFFCWLPFHVFMFLDQNHIYYNPEVIITGLNVGMILATVHSFLRPMLYVCMGNNVPPTLHCWSIVGRIMNVLGEEDPPTTTSHETSTDL